MRGSDIYARYGPQFSDHKGQLGSGSQIVKDIGLYPVRSEDRCGETGEFFREVPGIVSDHDTLLAGLLSFGYNEIGYALGSSSHGESVHPVGAGAYLAPQPGCTEAQVLVKTVPYLLFLSLYTPELGIQRVFRVQTACPSCVFIHMIHILSS